MGRLPCYVRPMRRMVAGLAALLTLGRSIPARAQLQVAPEAEVRDVESLHGESIATRRTLARAVLVGGIGSTTAGGLLMISGDEDSAFRFAGLNTAVFGVVNTIVSLLALHGIAHEEEQWESAAASADRRAPGGLARARVHAASDERREATSHAVNLGLAAAYLAVGGTAILASRLGVDHPKRWLASGAAIEVQALFLLGIDYLGLRRATHYHRLFVDALAPSVAVVPTSQGSETHLELGGRF